jgi:tungstate transport system substrate-binding protein
MLQRAMRLTFLILAVVFLAASASGQSLMLATTTSTDNTGLLDYLAPKLRQDTGIELKWTAVGTGKALELGRNCDVDVLLVHAPLAEKRYIDNGYGLARSRVMYNDFVLIGPKEDPASVQGLEIEKALQRIESAKATFVSRGDDSGTHKKERSLWKQAQESVPGDHSWYLEAGQGMMATIRVAAERRGYTLADRGTYIKYADGFAGRPPLQVLVEGGEPLFNQYSVIPVNPKRCPEVKADLAKRFADWITSPRAQRAIGAYRMLGQTLFTPNAEPSS